MLELEENSKLLKILEEKLQDLGESLWHFWIRKWIKRFRGWNLKRRFLARYQTF